jgi:hypothetical protein
MVPPLNSPPLKSVIAGVVERDPQASLVDLRAALEGTALETISCPIPPQPTRQSTLEEMREALVRSHTLQAVPHPVIDAPVHEGLMTSKVPKIHR